MDGSILNMISAFLEVSLIVLFVSIAIKLLIAARIGYKRGIYKSTYKMIGYAVLFILALVTMKPLTRMVYNLPIGGFFDRNPYPVDLSIGDAHIQFDLTISTVEATLTDFIRGFCNQINASESLNVSVNQFAKTITTSCVSLAVYFIDLTLITTLGNLFLELMWLLCFKKLTPKIAQRVGKIRFVGMAESIVTKMVLFFLAIAPMTSLVNSINQGIQKSNARNSQNQTVQEIVNLVDIYNDSLFAQAFFNWNTHLNGSGITFDQALMDFFTVTLNGGDDTISLGRELGNLAHSFGEIASVLGEGKDGTPVITEFSETLINPVFDLVGNSDLFNSLFEISLELAFNSDLLDGVIPHYEYFDRVDVSNISLNEEIEVFKAMANDIFDSKILDDLIIVEDGEMQFNRPKDIVEYLDDLFTLEENREKVNKIFNAFNRLDDLKLLKAAFQSLGYWAVTFDESNTVLKFLGGKVDIDKPYDDPDNKALVVDFINEFNIGHEMYMIFDSCWGIASCGEHVIKNAYNSFRSQTDTETKEEYEACKQDAKSALAATLRSNETTDNFRDAICGVNHTNADGSLQERDSTKGEHYSLMDSRVFAKLVNETPFLKNIIDNLDLKENYGEAYDEAKLKWDNLMDEVFSDTARAPIKFLKDEINYVLEVITGVIKLKLPESSTSPTPTALSMRLNEEESEETEEPKEFEYKDYPSFLEAAVNLFDGWINPKDVLGSALDLDSRIAPYLSEAFVCLKPLDNSKIVYALGIPFINAKLAEQKEKNKGFIDINIIIIQIGNSNNVFEQLSGFFNSDLISALQHFYKGFMTDSSGKFSFEAFTSNIQNDPNEFLSKFNSYLEIKEDNPDTAAYDPIFDSQPLKYYFAYILKALYRFELFNPHSGQFQNKNMQHMFDYIFGGMESNGIEKPSNGVYAQLDPEGKWETELDAICDLFGVLGDNNILNFNKYSSNVNSTLLYSLAGDLDTASSRGDYNPDMPMNLGEVLGAVGDSILFSNAMGGLLDQSLNGTLCDTTIGVTYKNINSGEYWHEEGDNMSDLLLTIAKLDLDLQNLDLTKVTDVVGMNDMLHKLSDSLIFKNETEGNKFGEWLHKKVDNAMNSMSEGLLNDPSSENWKVEWDSIVNTVNNEAYPNQKIATYDFLVRDGIMPSNFEDNKAAWCTTNYDALMSTFKNEINYEDLSKTEADELYKQPGFIENYYNKVLQYDELGRVVNVIANGIRIMDGNDSINFSSISSENLGDFLTSVNNTNCMRIASYNAMKLSKDNVGTNDLADINKATFEYMICAEADLDNYALGRINRQEEIDNFIKFYSNYKEIQRIAGNDLEADSFFNKNILMEILGVDSDGQDDPNGNDYLTDLLAGIQSTHCFHIDAASDRATYNISFFEDMMIKLMNNSGLTALAEATDEQMETRVKSLTSHDLYNTVNNEGYNSTWTEVDGANEIIGGENKCLTDVFKTVINATDGDSIDANTVTVTSLPASEVTDIMKAVNSSYLCTGVMNRFTKDAFSGDLGLIDLLKYEDTDTEMLADFDLNYLDYGGANNACDEGTEIYCIQKAIESMQYQDPATNEYKFVNLKDFHDSLSKKSDCLDGVFYFLFNSKTLEKTEERDSTIIKGRSLMLYNALDNFDAYLIGSDKPSKIDAIEKMYGVATATNGDKDYLVEANGLTRLIDAAGNTITNVTVDTLRVNSTKRNMILNVIKYTYDRNDGDTFSTDVDVKTSRAYFISEIVSGIFDDVLATEYGTINSNFVSGRIATFDDHEKFYFASNGLNGKAISSADVNANMFDNLNEVERVGLEGAIEMTNFFNGEANRAGTDLTNIEDNIFVSSVVTNSPRIRQLFSEYFYNTTEHRDSRFAKILFISRGALSIEKETATFDDIYPEDSGLFVMLKYTHVIVIDSTTHPSDCIWKVVDGYTEDYYDSSFNFDVYGNNLMDYIDSCTA